MKQILLRVEDDEYAAVKASADQNGRSLNRELRHMIRTALAAPGEAPLPGAKLFTLAERTRSYGSAKEDAKQKRWQQMAIEQGEREGLRVTFDERGFEQVAKLYTLNGNKVTLAEAQAYAESNGFWVEMNGDVPHIDPEGEIMLGCAPDEDEGEPT